MEFEVKKQEAIKRMKMLGLYPTVIEEFEQENKLNLSECQGMLYWLTDKQQQVVKAFEQKYNSVVYHVIHTFTEFGELLTLLYVSDYEDEWEYDNDDLEQGYPCAYVVNLDDDICSEFGGIGIRPVNGGLIRTM